MPTTKSIAVSELTLDLKNFRTVPQKNEVDALHAMLSIAPDKFWALTESLLDDGYLPTENIIVLNTGKEKIVKEGNRRIGALKLVFGIIKRQGLGAPDDVEEKISKQSKAWQEKNKEVPCAVYDLSEADVVDRIVTLAHGKGEAAGRDNWKSIARARHNREKNGASEPALDLLEKYLTAGKGGKNLTQEQRERWAGDYPLTVLEDAIKRLAPRLGFAISKELADGYPKKVKRKKELDALLRDVGMEVLDFETLRSKTVDFGAKYGMLQPQQPAGITTTQPGSSGGSLVGGGSGATGSNKLKAVAANDPQNVIRTLKKFFPKGNNREKLVTLLDEARKLKLYQHPLSFCFLLRSMFEISAKAYCMDNAAAGGPSATKASGDDRTLVDVLKDVATHLTKNNSDKAMKKELHGAIAELAKPEGFLSVTSMNQLVHNPKFIVDETHISNLFANVFPLLQAMNR